MTVYPSSTLRQQVRESHLQLESWSIRLNNKPTPATRDVNAWFPVSVKTPALEASPLIPLTAVVACGRYREHPATLEKKSLAPRVEEKNKPPPPPPPPPPKTNN